MAAIETTDDIMDKLRLAVGQLGIAAVRTLQILFESQDPKNTGCVANAQFTSMLMKGQIFVSQMDSSNIFKTFAVSELEISYSQFMQQLSPPLTKEREAAAEQLFARIAAEKETGDLIRRADLLALCEFGAHPEVASGQISQNRAKELITTAFDSIGDGDDGEISLGEFLYYFRGIASGYPYSTAAMVCFIESVWRSLYREAKAGSLSAKEAQKCIEQIEAMLAEKTRQKIKGSDNEESTLLKAFKHFDSKALEFVSYAEFVRTLESFGVLAPEKELTMLFEKWCQRPFLNDAPKKLCYRPFVRQLFRTY